MEASCDLPKLRKLNLSNNKLSSVDLRYNLLSLS